MDVPSYSNSSEFTRFYIEISNSGYCHLKIGSGYQAFADRMTDFHLDVMNKTGLDSIRIFPDENRTLIIARTEEGIEGIVFGYEMDPTRPLVNAVLWDSIQDKGVLILNNLEIALYTKLQDRSDEELNEIWR